MQNILITGGTGFIGKHLIETLRTKGYKISILSRKNSDQPNIYFWDIEKGYIEPKAIEEADYIIHLAGAGIGDARWTKNRKKELIDSRVESTKLLYKNVVKLNPNLKGFIAASGVGFYGAITSEKIFTENDTSGTDFLATICKLWEKESMQFDLINSRTVIFRTGVVLANKDGAFEKILKPIKLGIGAALGSGNQYMPWIHINDLCNMYVSAIENKELHGIYNAVAPEAVTNSQLTKTIAQELGKKIRLPNIPSLILKIMLGKMSIILLEGSRISSKKIEESGFQFNFSTIKTTVRSMLS